MSLWTNLRWRATGFFGKRLFWILAKSGRWTVLGDEAYKKAKEQGKPVILLVWHGRIFIVPYFFRKRGIMPLISPSKDGEIAAQIMARWGYKILRGSSSHSIIKAWNEMKKELENGGEIIIVPDGPRGPDRVLKAGCIKLAQETGACLVPFSFSASKKRILKSWDHFLMFPFFSKVVAMHGPPLEIPPAMTDEEFERERQRVEKVLIELDQKADSYFP
jgi:lysophospholipid acyltransferase (LPLAT)-like uncharacterized protein